MRVGEPRRDFDLPQEALGTERRGDLGTQHFDRHRAAVLQVPREIDGRHPAAPQLALERVAVGQGRAETIERRDGHPRPTRFSSAPKLGSSRPSPIGPTLRNTPPPIHPPASNRRTPPPPPPPPDRESGV